MSISQYASVDFNKQEERKEALITVGIFFAISFIIYLLTGGLFGAIVFSLFSMTLPCILGFAASYLTKRWRIVFVITWIIWLIVGPVMLFLITFRLYRFFR